MNEILALLKANQKGIIVVSIAIVLDIVSGVIKASLNSDLKSSEFRTGLMKKVLDYILIVVAFSLDFLMGLEYVGTCTLYSLCAMELYSVLENVKEYIPLPKALEKALNALQAKDGE